MLLNQHFYKYHNKQQRNLFLILIAKDPKYEQSFRALRPRSWRGTTSLAGTPNWAAFARKCAVIVMKACSLLFLGGGPYSGFVK